MTATNHALSGALIGAFVPLPLAIPLAFISHFVLDAIPHYGIPLKKRNNTFVYRLIVYGDTLVALSIAATALLLHKWNMEIVGWIAYSPDALWVLHYFMQDQNLHIQTKNKFMEFHRYIQRWERPWGIAIDLGVTAALLPVFLKQVLK